MKNLLFILAFTLSLFACNTKSSTTSTVSKVSIPDTVLTTLHVEGMTCDHCEMTVQGSVKEIAGIISIKADFEDSTTVVSFDASQTNIGNITKAIEQKGYKVVNKN